MSILNTRPKGSILPKKVTTEKKLMHEPDIFREVQKKLAESKKQSTLWYQDIIHASNLLASKTGEVNQSAMKYTYEDGSIKDFVDKVEESIVIGIKILLNLDSRFLPNKFIQSVECK